MELVLRGLAAILKLKTQKSGMLHSSPNPQVQVVLGRAEESLGVGKAAKGLLSRCFSISQLQALMLVFEVSVESSAEGHYQPSQSFISSVTQDRHKCLMTTES